MPTAKLFVGFSCLFEGIGLLFRPGLRRFVLLPLAINLLLFVLIVVTAFSAFASLLNALLSLLPDWAAFLRWILWPLFALLLAVLVALCFNLFAGLIAAPFNGLLAEKVEVLLGGADDFPPFTWDSVLASFRRELRKLAWYLPRLLLLFILSFIPLLNLIAVPLLFLLSVWMMALQYLDYPAENHGLNFPQTLDWLRQKRWQALSFGTAAWLFTLVLGWLLMPAAVAGATVLWLREENRYRKAG